MNHSDRIARVARQQRRLTRPVVAEIVALYLAVLSDDIANGEWVELPGIGKLQVIREETSGTLHSITHGGKRVKRKPGMRLRTKMRLSDTFKRRCHEEK
jgi:nucleoid DNA-binding protein